MIQRSSSLIDSSRRVRADSYFRPHSKRIARYVNNAIAPETEIKAWRREKKVALIAANNPTWEDLAEDWESRWQCAHQIPPG